VSSRVVAVVVGSAALVAGVVGCSSGSSGGAAPASGSTTPQPTATVTVTETPTSTAGTSTPTPTQSAAHPTAAACSSGQLRLSLGAGQGTAGATYQPIVFTNTASKPCSLFGYPGVSFVDAGGTQLGKPAAHATGAKQLVTLAGHGGTASALLKEPDPGVFSPSNCHQTTASRLKVYPPNQTVALLVSDPALICTTKAGRTSVRPVVPGSTGE
jgi:hypothetical protein